jgi:hypothetical protein
LAVAAFSVASLADTPAARSTAPLEQLTVSQLFKKKVRCRDYKSPPLALSFARQISPSPQNMFP